MENLKKQSKNNIAILTPENLKDISGHIAGFIVRKYKELFPNGTIIDDELLLTILALHHFILQGGYFLDDNEMEKMIEFQLHQIFDIDIIKA